MVVERRRPRAPETAAFIKGGQLPPQIDDEDVVDGAALLAAVHLGGIEHARAKASPLQLRIDGEQPELRAGSIDLQVDACSRSSIRFARDQEDAGLHPGAELRRSDARPLDEVPFGREGGAVDESGQRFDVRGGGQSYRMPSLVVTLNSRKSE